VNVAGFNIAGSGALVFPVASCDPASPKGGPATQGFGVNAFLAMFSAAAETLIPEVPLTSHVSATSETAPQTKERLKQKDGVVPAAASGTLDHATAQQAASVDLFAVTASPAVVTTVFPVPAPLPANAGSVPALQAVQNTLGKESAQQLPGWTAESSVVGFHSINPAEAFTASGSSASIRIDAPIAFALQLSAKTEPPAVQQSIETPKSAGIAVNAPALENPVSAQTTLPASPMLFLQAPRLSQSANATPEVRPQTLPDAVVVLPVPVPDGLASAAASATAASAIPIPARESQADARKLEKHIVPPALSSADESSKALPTPDAAESSGNGFSRKTPASSQASLPGENQPEAGVAELQWSDHQITQESDAATKDPANTQPVEFLAVKHAADASTKAPTSEKDQVTVTSASSKSPVEAHGQRAGLWPEGASKDGRSAAAIADRGQNTEFQTTSQDAVSKAQPASKVQAKDSRENPGYGSSNSDRGGQDETLPVSGAMLQTSSESFTVTASGEQHPAPPPNKEFLREADSIGVVRPVVARGISLQLEGVPGVAVQVSERGGKIDIAVRSGDTQLSKSLQSGLGDLVAQLENRGFKTDAWTPGVAGGATSEHAEPSSNLHHSGHSGAGSSKQEHQSDPNQRRRPAAREAFGETLVEEDARTE
jgi:hypothetical protein